MTLAQAMNIRPSALLAWAEARAEHLGAALSDRAEDVRQPATGDPLIVRWAADDQLQAEPSDATGGDTVRRAPVPPPADTGDARALLEETAIRLFDYLFRFPEARAAMVERLVGAGGGPVSRAVEPDADPMAIEAVAPEVSTQKTAHSVGARTRKQHAGRQKRRRA